MRKPPKIVPVVAFCACVARKSEKMTVHLCALCECVGTCMRGRAALEQCGSFMHSTVHLRRDGHFARGPVSPAVSRESETQSHVEQKRNTEEKCGLRERERERDR